MTFYTLESYEETQRALNELVNTKQLTSQQLCLFAIGCVRYANSSNEIESKWIDSLLENQCRYLENGMPRRRATSYRHNIVDSLYDTMEKYSDVWLVYATANQSLGCCQVVSRNIRGAIQHATQAAEYARYRSVPTGTQYYFVVDKQRIEWQRHFLRDCMLMPYKATENPLEVYEKSQMVYEIEPFIY